MSNAYQDIDTKPADSIVIGDKNGVRTLAKYEPGQLRNTSPTLIEKVLALPAPVPSREPVTVDRQRLEGAQEKSTPIMRAIASVIRSGKYLLVVAFVGIISYIAVPTVSGLTVFFCTLVAMALVMLCFDLLEYVHSQPGVERLRSKQDHKLEIAHEDNRHTETMSAMSNDYRLKMKAIESAIDVFNGRITG